jgi:hypothetical protein
MELKCGFLICNFSALNPPKQRDLQVFPRNLDYFLSEHTITIELA